AIGAYFAGGPLADRFSARQLMSVAVATTALGGIWMASIPSLAVLTLLYGFWGLTTILLFWAALIRATREWGGSDSQGQAFGILDGGRGLFVALLSSISVAIFASLMPEEVEAATFAQRKAALSQIIWIFAGLGFVVALLLWFFIPDGKANEIEERKNVFSAGRVKKVFSMPQIWLQALIVVCAYVGYKMTDDYSLLARDAFGYNEVDAAGLGTISFWVRPFAALGAGLLADRLLSSQVVQLGFITMMVGCLLIYFDLVDPGVGWMLIFTIIVASIGIYGLRGVYFALFEEGKVPLAFTGTAVGIVSVIGYTPDVFMGPLMGYLIDKNPGPLGHQHVFGVVALFALVGFLATWAFRQVNKPQNTPLEMG
ncbi:MAG: MFS transporter, partial [Bacteroidota bacterium]